jgi:hypothetical protein
MAAPILKLGTRWEGSGQVHVPADLLKRNEPPVPIVQESGRVPELVRTLWKREQIFALVGPESQFLGSKVSSLVSIMTVLPTVLPCGRLVVLEVMQACVTGDSIMAEVITKMLDKNELCSCIVKVC